MSTVERYSFYLFILFGFVSLTHSICSPPWKEYNKKCYFFTNNRYRYSDGLVACSTRNASFFVFENDAELDWVKSQVSHGTRWFYWVGLQIQNGSWTWIDGQIYDKNSTHWYRNTEGNVKDTRHACVAFPAYKPYTGQMYQRNCGEQWPVICKKPYDSFELCDGNDNWHHINKSCIKYFEQEETWMQSRSICQAEGGDLYYPKNYEMIMSIGDLLVCRTVDEQAWIGVSDTVQPGRFLGVDNSTMRYQPWQGSNRVILQKGNTCVISNPMASFYWEVDLCDARKKFICEKPQGTCPDGWRRSKDMCFQIYDTTNLRTTWVGAYNYCKSQGTDLAVIESQDEDQTLASFLRTRRVTEAWIGCSDINMTDTMQWIDGRALSSVSYTHWTHGYPKPDNQRTDCCEITSGRLGSSWSNTYCFNNKPFICKKKVVAPLLQPTPPPATSHCDPGWKLYNSSCYYFGAAFNMTGYSWDDARRYCYSQRADLTTIKDPMEQSFITLNMEAFGSAWIGLKYYKEYKKYLWAVDHSSANYLNYYPGEPDDLDSGQACIQILAGRQDYTGSWDDGNCSTPQDFICKKPAAPGGPSATPPPSTTPVGTWSYRCGPSWTFNSLDEFCYQIVTDAFKTWADANYDCKQRGGYLLSISGPKEQTFIQAMLNTGVYLTVQGNYWIGASDATQEGGWEWIDNAPFSYLHWHPGEPNEYGVGEDCGEIVSAWGYEWNDKRCDKEQHYICKKIPDPPTQKPGAPTQSSSGQCVVQPMISGDYSLLDGRSLSASSSRDATHGPTSSRYYPGSRGGWSSKTTTSNEYIQATFLNVVVIKGVITVGRSDANEWVSQYRIRYQYDYFDEWLWYEEPPGTVKTFTGNTDNVSPVNNTIQFPIEAKAIRLYPLKYNRGMSLRWEVLGCIEEFCTPDYAVSGPLVVLDVQIRTSTNADRNHAGPAARLSPLRPGVQIACWKPAIMDTNQYIQVDLGNILIIRGVTTMGNPDAQEWVTVYQISYGMQVDSVSNYYQEPFGTVKKFQGNTNNNDTVTNFFKGHFQGRFLRIWPNQFQGAIALRFDVLVCTHGCKGLALISGPKRITDDMLNATSSSDAQHGPARSRLNQPAQGNFAGGWTAKYNDLHQYIQADLGSTIQITGVATQGREDGSAGQWIKTYYLSYSQDGTNWVSYSGIQRNALLFTGNWDQNSVRKHLLYIPFLARYVRLWPRSWNNQISLRWELYGCPGPDSGFSLGCFADDTHDRDLPLEPFTDPSVGMWPPMCIHHCFRKGYYYAGLQAQYKCFCGNTYGRYGPSTSCNMSCYPRTRFKCGGLTSNQIYSTGLIPQNEVCPPQWKSYKDYCYLVLLDRKTWREARHDCHMMGGDLATINSQAEQDLIYSIINGNGGKDVWIGLNDQVEENLFQWARGEPVMYTNWDIHQPEHPANQDEDCVMIAPGLGGWRDEVCDSTHQYVCQAHKHSSNQPSTMAQSTGCEKGWDAYRWSCYLYIDMPRNYNDAITLCRSRGATLVRIEDRYEQAYLSSVLGSRNGQYWTYITDAYSPGTFKYLDGGALQMTNWAQDRPACQGCCVAIETGSSAGLWNDILCNSTVGAICEKTRLGYTTPTPPPTVKVGLTCPAGWTDINDGFCYQINYPDAKNQLLNYDDALQDCHKQTTDLVSFHNQTSMNLLYKHLSPGRNYWLGLNARTSINSKLVYRWTDQTPLDFIYWNPNEPNNWQGSERCAHITGYGSRKWNDIRCSFKFGWICKMRKGANYQPRTTLNFILPTVSGGAGSCGSALTGWKYYNNRCYIAIDGVGKMSKTWREARQWCANSGADLVAINSIFEQIFVNQQVTNITATDLWVGLSEINFEYGYRWSDGSTVSFVNWAPGQPDDYAGAEDCVEYQVASTKWNDAHCAEKKGFMCELSLSATPPPTVPSTIQGYCPVGFSGFRNRCFKVVIANMNWTQASASCQSLGGGRKGYYLASILDKYESAFITSLLSGLKVSPWIGLQTFNNGRMFWIDNQDLKFTNWDHGEPNLPRWQMKICASISSRSHNAGKWDDLDCSTSNSYICATNKKTYITTPEPIPNPCNTKMGFQPFGADCLLFGQTPKSWNDADTYCKSLGGFLATISTEFEQSFVFLMVNNNQTGATKLQSWIGLNDIAQPGTYQWSQPNWPLTYSKWAPSQPIKKPGGGCVSLEPQNGQWSDSLCNTTYPFICKITTASPPNVPPLPNGQCQGSNWVAHNNKCYNFQPTDGKAYLDAVLECQRQKATLVSIHSMAENNFLMNTLKTITTQSYGIWTSFHKSPEGTYGWVDGSFTQFVNWDVGQPSGKGDNHRTQENCMMVQPWNGKWNDMDCSLKRGYICERNQISDTIVKTPPPVAKVTSPLISPTMFPTPPTQPYVTNLPVVTFNVPTGPPPTTKRIKGPTGGNNQGTIPPLPSVGTVPNYTGKQTGTSSVMDTLGAGGIAGILVGVIVILCLVGIAIILYRRKYKSEGLGQSFENSLYAYNAHSEKGNLSLNNSSYTEEDPHESES